MKEKDQNLCANCEYRYHGCKWEYVKDCPEYEEAEVEWAPQ